MRIDVGFDLAQAREAYTPVPAERALVPVQRAKPADPALLSRLQEAAGGIDIRSVSPRRIADLGLDLHLAGYLEWDEYAMLAFQPELHPDYDRTVGALTGERAQPDRPRDYLAAWEDRVAFETRYPSEDGSSLARSERIVSVLRLLDQPLDLTA